MMSPLDTPAGLWHLKRLAVYWLAASSLFLSWYLLGPSRAYWDALDLGLFRLTNASLAGRETAQIFWAWANTRAFDLLMLVFQIVFFIAVGPRQSWQQRLAQFVFLYSFAHLALTSAHKGMECIFDIDRLSPNALLTEGVRISHALDCLHVKDASWHSFPGDHSVILSLWALSCGFFKGWKYGAIAMVAACAACVPRLYSGAHWASDMLVGGGTITLFLYGVASATPLHHWAVSKLFYPIARIQQPNTVQEWRDAA